MEAAEAALLDGIAAGDDVEQQPAAGEPLERRRLVGGQRAGDEARPERDQELQPPGDLGERRLASFRSATGLHVHHLFVTRPPELKAFILANREALLAEVGLALW